YRPDGAIDYLSRVDHQIKVRGFRIELGEIEAALRQHEAVRDVVVIVREETGDPRIVAYVTEEPRTKNLEPNDSREVLPLGSKFWVLGSALRAFLAKRLPAYMLPSAFVLLDALPLTPNGKLDRKALPQPDAARADGEQAYVAPRTPAEELLASIWAEVLHVERVGIDDNFFALGGHSLLATQVIARARAAFQANLPLRALFETPTVAGLATQLAALQRQAAGNAIPPIVAIARDGGLPLSFAQQRLWFLDQLDPGTSAYNVPVAVRLSGPLDLPAVQRSIDTIVQRHETLRTVFATEHDEPVQIILPALGLPLAIVDLRTWPEAEREHEAQRLAIAEAAQPFDLKTGPLVRVTVLLLDRHESICLLTMHHIVSDGWSLGVFVRELITLYSAYTADESIALPALPIQYADYASWQRQWLQGEVLDQQLAYWTDRLAGSPALLSLPTDQPTTDAQTVQGGHQSLRLPPELTQDLKQLSQREGVTLFMTLLAAYQVVLSHLTGQRDLLVGAPIANRTRPEVENLIGFFINTLVLRADLSGNPRIREWLDQVRSTTLGAYAHQDLPFELLVAELQPARAPGRPVLVQATFNLQNAPMPALNFAAIELRPYDVPGGATRFELALIAEETPQGLLAQLHYRADLFAASTIERLLLHFQTILQTIVTQPDVTLADLFALLTDADKQQRAAQQQERKATQLQKLRTIKRSALSASSNTEHNNDQ
ncbi:MAG: non-ribosomal peptide synthetase, partial [Chloroflexi bacterium]|nr:non-ribosomal peptide synthetase [Chloroflexota bacterium]